MCGTGGGSGDGVTVCMRYVRLFQFGKKGGRAAGGIEGRFRLVVALERMEGGR